MAEIINLNHVRKARERQEKEASAAANRVKHGRTKAERKNDAETAQKIARDLAGKEIEHEKP